MKIPMENLLQPLVARSLTLSNRVVMAPMTRIDRDRFDLTRHRIRRFCCEAETHENSQQRDLLPFQKALWITHVSSMS